LSFWCRVRLPSLIAFLFHRRDAKNLSAYCTCPAGESGMHCKHRVRILRGLLEGIVSKNTADVTTVAGWLSGSDVETALRTIDDLEKEADRIKKALSAAKKALSQCLLD
jgi:uncharacterized Zn finger protein